MPYKPECGHKWVPFGKRLRCEWCDALGYTRAAAPGAKKANERIYVLICGASGCRKPAVVVEDGGNNRCKEHRR